MRIYGKNTHKRAKYYGKIVVEDGHKIVASDTNYLLR